MFILLWSNGHLGQKQVTYLIIAPLIQDECFTLDLLGLRCFTFYLEHSCSTVVRTWGTNLRIPCSNLAHTWTRVPAVALALSLNRPHTPNFVIWHIHLAYEIFCGTSIFSFYQQAFFMVDVSKSHLNHN